MAQSVRDDHRVVAKCEEDAETERIPTHEFRDLKEVCRWGWDDSLGTISTDPISDQAIVMCRDVTPERMVVHSMQPHRPFIPSDIQTDLDPDEFCRNGSDSVWDLLRNGKLEYSTV